MTKDDAVPVTAEHRNAAADLIEAYWQGAGEQHDQMRELAARYRAGHSQGVWADAFARFERDILARHRGSTAGVDDFAARKAVNGVLAGLLAPLMSDLPKMIEVGNQACTEILAALASLSQTPATPMVQEGLREAVSVHRMTRAAAERYGFDIPTLEHFGLLADSLSPAPPVDETDRLRSALRPFAHAAKWWKAFHDYHRITTLHQHGDCLEVGHLRAAEAALADRTQEGDAGK